MTDQALKVLIVDDSPDSRELTAAQLDILGHDPRCVSGGEAALAALDTAPYDLVLTDLRMAGMDGYELILRIMAREVPLRVVVLSAAVPSSERERCLLVGVERCLVRPVELADLRAALQSRPALAPTDPPLVGLDRQRLDVMVAQMGDAGQGMLRTMAAIFLEETPQDLAALAAAEVRGDGQEAARLAHLIKGRALSLGANLLADACASFEEGQACGNLEKLYNEAAGLLREYLRSFG